MGMGYMGALANILPHESMKDLFPSESVELESILEETEVDLDDFFREFNEMGGPGLIDEDKVNAIEPKLQALQEAFTGKYPSLSIIPFYHYEDDGDRYDEFFGGGWEVLGVFEKVEDAKQVESDLGDPEALNYKSLTYYG